MAQEDAKITMSADDRQVERAWSRQFAHLDRLERKLDQVGSSGVSSALKGMKSFAGWAAGIAFVKSAADALTASLKKTEQANQEMRESASRTTQDAGDWLFKLAKQGGMGAIRDPKERLAAIEALRQRIGAIDIREGLPEHTSMRHAKEAFSQGAKGDIGDIADFFGKLSVAIDSENPETLAQSVIGLTKSAGLDPTLENLKRTGIAMQRSFLNEPMQLADFEKLAARGRGISGMAGTSIERTIAMGSVLREVMPGEKGATAAEAIFTRMATAGGNATRVEALGMMGLTAEDVDMKGEDAVQALERVSDALSKMDEVAAKVAVNKFFGEGATSAFLQLASSTGEIRRREKLYDDPAGFERDVQLMRDNPAARVRRAENRLAHEKFAPGAEVDDVVLADLETAGLRQRLGAGKIAAQKAFFLRHRNRGRSVPEALDAAFKGAMDPGDIIGQGEGLIDDMAEALKAQVDPGTAAAMKEEILRQNPDLVIQHMQAEQLKERQNFAKDFLQGHPAMRVDPDTRMLGGGTAQQRIQIELQMEMRDLLKRQAEEMERLREKLSEPQKMTLDVNGAQLPAKKVQPQ